jgi:C_GCAxxG_C_C family probable redox protein
MSDEADRAAQRLAEGFNCAQAVLGALAPALGLPVDAASKVAATFGGGIARMGDTCGAVTGALMAIGLARGATRGDDQETKDEGYRVANEFLRRFGERHDTVECRALIGGSISTPEGMQAARDRGVFTTVCPALVRDAAEIARDLVASPRAGSDPGSPDKTSD